MGNTCDYNGSPKPARASKCSWKLERNQHALSTPDQFSIATPLRARDQSVDLLDLPMPEATSISIPPASTSPTIKQSEPDNQPIQIPQPAFVTGARGSSPSAGTATAASAQAQWSLSQTAASRPQQRAPLATSADYAMSAQKPVCMPDVRYMPPS